MQLLRASGISPLSSTPLWERELGEEQLVAEFQQECANIRKALDGDLCKVGSSEVLGLGCTSLGNDGECLVGMHAIQAAVISSSRQPVLDQ